MLDYFCGAPQMLVLFLCNRAALYSLALWSHWSADAAEKTQDVYICVEQPASDKT